MLFFWANYHFQLFLTSLCWTTLLTLWSGRELWGRRDWIWIPGGWDWRHSSREARQSILNWSSCEVSWLWSVGWWWERNGGQQSLRRMFERCHAKDSGPGATALIISSLQEIEWWRLGVVLLLIYYRTLSTECLIRLCLMKKPTIQEVVMIKCKLVSYNHKFRNNNKRSILSGAPQQQ